MSLGIFTIWDPKNNERTIQDHIDLLTKHGAFKWGVIHKQKGFPSSPLEAEQIERIHKLIKEGREVHLYIRSKVNWDVRLYAARLNLVEPGDIPWEDDPLVHDYYRLLKEQRPALWLSHWFTLLELQQVPADDFMHLHVSEELRHPKYIYEFPCPVHRARFRSYFSPFSVLTAEDLKSITIEEVSLGPTMIRGYVVKVNGRAISEERNRQLFVQRKELELLKVLKRGKLAIHDLAEKMNLGHKSTQKAIDRLNGRFAENGLPSIIDLREGLHALTAKIFIC